MTITVEQARSMDHLAAQGFAITNFYADGAVRMQERDPALSHNEALYTFVRPDGSIKPLTTPRGSHEIILAKEAGITVC